MAWSGVQKAKALEEVGALTASGMQAKVAVEVVSKRTGVPVRTLESWHWPSKRKEDASPPKAALIALTEKEDSPPKAALIALLKRAAEQGNDVTIQGLDFNRTPARPDLWVDLARDRGMNDMEVLGALCIALYDEAARLKGHCDRMDMILRAQL